MNEILWRPKAADIKQSQMMHFMHEVNRRFNKNFEDYTALHTWSVTEPENFWKTCAQFCQLEWQTPPVKILDAHKDMKQCHWFTGATLNFAEQLLKRKDHHPAIIAVTERGDKREIPYAELNDKVTKLAQVFQDLGLKPLDRVAAVLPNTAAAVIAMLATTKLGAIWTACSPDFGLEALMNRFQQIEPTLLITVDSHYYKGKTFDHTERNQQLEQQLSSLKATLYLENEEFVMRGSNEKNSVTARSTSDEYFDFNHPLYILYSSGTTGKPKCIVHGAGGTLVQHLKELRLHTNITADSRIFFHCTTAWMMWHWLVSSLAIGATIVLYEGCPTYPSPDHFFKLIDEIGITTFGSGAKFFELCAQSNLKPKRDFDLSTLNCILSTGSVLLPTSFDYVYEHIKSDIRLSSISGGTDIISCFALGNPILPVYRGELQCLGLGMNVKVFNDTGKPVIEEKGELVCISPCPSMPLYFWDDPQGEKYQQAYFERFKGVWTHGDYAMETVHHGLIIYGRSDTTLNPRGVRIGSSEIYEQLNKIPEIQEALVIGQNWHGDERVILFVVLKSPHQLTTELKEQIKTQLKKHASSHHVPQKIIAVEDLPRTPNQKMAELWVKKLIEGRSLPSTNALENPECLSQFTQLKELYED